MPLDAMMSRAVTYIANGPRFLVLNGQAVHKSDTCTHHDPTSSNLMRAGNFAEESRINAALKITQRLRDSAHSVCSRHVHFMRRRHSFGAA